MGRAGLTAFYCFFSSIWRIISRIDSDGSPRKMQTPPLWALGASRLGRANRVGNVLETSIGLLLLS
jgi:hypothetical protein